MKNLEASSRATRALHIAADLFKQYGFNKVGVDRILIETKIPKATFYNYFHSKERLIEMCLVLQKDQLKEKVRAVCESCQYPDLSLKLRQIYLLHADLKSAYYLLFKAIFEIEKLYPNAYQSAVRYRQWLKNEIFSLLMENKKTASYEESDIFVFMIDGAILGRLSSNKIEDQTKLLDYFLKITY
ncbi:TetR/AcrR family transcriptional regulator [Acinetobacter oleivorans]|uniref:TetR/AcrR family transcriptional regulator n=1 Tax=Acinetobacter oleivorans TaxID=1148157 RepID=UPI001900AFB0|nr:TetR/AcrR family transcriptional regulator [Acinetobacter oleivorans]MBJ8498526.1 TetR/AcrR family transcriptional regulator [Acinetobacter oleivorans]